MILVLAFSFSALLVALLWAGWVVLNFWVFQKTKAVGNLLMLIGAAISAFFGLMSCFGIAISGDEWLPLVAMGLTTLGFYFSVKPMVSAQLAASLNRLRSKGVPPPAPPAPPSV